MMSNSKNENPSRRKFLSFGFLGGASLLAGTSAKAQSPNLFEEKVKMLTPDGQLVEVDKHVLDAINDREKANNEAILSWSKTAK